MYTATGVEWDEAKRLSNLKRHGIDFYDAALIFRGRVIEASDGRADYGEARYRALGEYRGVVMLVAYTIRGGNRRTISAWKVNDDGKRRYSALLAPGP